MTPMLGSHKRWAVAAAAIAWLAAMQPAPSAAGSHNATLVLKVIVPPPTPTVEEAIGTAVVSSVSPHDLDVNGTPVEVSVVPLASPRANHRTLQLEVRAN